MQKSPLLRPLDRVRRNHALEHATIAVLIENGVRPPLAGYSVPGGFLVYGRVSTEMLSAASSQALDRLQSGERELAISPYCGSNLVVGAVLAIQVINCPPRTRRVEGMALRHRIRPASARPIRVPVTDRWPSGDDAYQWQGRPLMRWIRL